jgi:hypothetical protein
MIFLNTYRVPLAVGCWRAVGSLGTLAGQSSLPQRWIAAAWRQGGGSRGEEGINGRRPSDWLSQPGKVADTCCLCSQLGQQPTFVSTTFRPCQYPKKPPNLGPPRTRATRMQQFEMKNGKLQLLKKSTRKQTNT